MVHIRLNDIYDLRMFTAQRAPHLKIRQEKTEHRATSLSALVKSQTAIETETFHVPEFVNQFSLLRSLRFCRNENVSHKLSTADLLQICMKALYNMHESTV